MTKLLLNNFLSAIVAGIFISIGCIVNLKVGGIWGAILFSFGLLSVCYYCLKLYTGTAGFIQNKREDWLCLGVILVGNVMGCALMAGAVNLAQPDILLTAKSITQGRLNSGPLNCFILAIGCGIIMTTAVEHFRTSKERVLPILIGVPVFILAGFAHSVADAFYYLCNPTMPTESVWLSEVLGNFVGCNLVRWIFSINN